MNPFQKITVVLVCLGLLFHGCKDERNIKIPVESIQLDLEVKRFDRDLAATEVSTLPQLKSRYPYLFPERFADSIWEAKLSDTLQLALLEEVDKVFGDFEEVEGQLEMFYKHLKYYFPEVTTPDVVTVISEVDYANRIIITDSLALIGLDNYLGQDHRFYGGIDRYIAETLERKYLISDLGSAYGQKLVPNPRERTFLAQMVYYGKILYLKEVLAPWLDEGDYIRYSAEDLEWAQANEEQIWRYFVSNELLYSTDRELNRRFLDPAPFSKFRLELDNESPGMLGRYIGWQIIKAFAEQSELTPQQLISIPASRIFKESKYKPRN